ncbi:hypothetical protein HanXRQr2_Chr05g0220841 [Helianthus annuus]|uniref:Uncharacterized protein n=1 Tax=Helianthus annuus TaxID=4232 RepID=A0A9K3NNN6_HELAN|nr:hypothetical protein HanXRQr2_Chr05g0220841 [Helianthus annuus]KAJ0923228.1 hypothetical protein HanPSC8_Chr05g0213321 [Helianthus annuus]
MVRLASKLMLHIKASLVTRTQIKFWVIILFMKHFSLRSMVYIFFV